MLLIVLDIFLTVLYAHRHRYYQRPTCLRDLALLSLDDAPKGYDMFVNKKDERAKVVLKP